MPKVLSSDRGAKAFDAALLPSAAEAALALQAGVVSVTNLAVEMQKLGGLPRRPVAPDARDLRYRILKALRSALADSPRLADLDTLIENVSGFGLRLRASAQVVRNRDELVA